jgi:hypothetical protein
MGLPADTEAMAMTLQGTFRECFKRRQLVNEKKVLPLLYTTPQYGGG